MPDGSIFAIPFVPFVHPFKIIIYCAYKMRIRYNRQCYKRKNYLF